MKVGGKYNWKGQRERLVYTGRNWSGNGYWHQFEKVGEPGVVWCEVVDADLAHFEESEPAPAYLLPEASEPVAWQHLKAYGYAPGNYMNKCHTCGKVVEFVDKRAITCRPCAEARHAAAPSPVAQAPAQAGEVVEAIRVLWEEIGTYSVQCTKTGELAPCRSLVDAVDALAALATQPLAAPVQQEAWKPTEDQILAAAEKAGLWPNTVHHWIGAFDRFFDALALAIPPSQPVLAPVVREPLSDERINLICRQELCQEDGLDYYAYSGSVHWWGGEGQIAAFARAVIQATTGEQSHGN